jgi:hypothetical protein
MGKEQEKVLTAKVAREAVERDNCDLSEYTEIEEAAAKILAKYEGSLVLDGLSLIPDSVALSLAKHRDDLSLNGLVRLTPESANALAKHRGPLLSLDGLGNLHVRARYLLRLVDQGLPDEEIRRRVYGYGNQESDEWVVDLRKALEALAKHNGTLRLSGVEASLLEYADSFAESLAKLLREHKGTLLLWGLEHLSVECAQSLAKAKNNIGLGITTITDPVAEALALHEGNLWLDGLDELSEETANILSRHKGGLSFDGLKSLDLNAARALAGHKGELSFAGLEEFPSEMFDIFDAHDGKVTVSMLTDIGNVAAAHGDDDREFLVTVGYTHFYKGGTVGYSGYQIMTRGEIRSLAEKLSSAALVDMPDLAEYYEDFVEARSLKDAFSIRSPWPSEIHTIRRTLGGSFGGTSLFDSVLDAELQSGIQDNGEQCKDEEH